MTIRTTCLAFAALLYPCAIQNAALALTLAELVEAHTATVDSLHRFDAQLTIYEYAKLGDANVPVMAKWRWSKDGTRTRIRHVYLDSSGEPLESRIGDVLMDGKQTKYIAGWDPASPPKLAMYDQSNVKAFIQPQTLEVPMGVVPSNLLLLTFSLTNQSPPRTLQQLVARSVGSTAEKVVNGGKTLWKLNVIAPESAGRPSKSSFEIYLDPQFGFLANRAINHVASHNKRPAFDLVRYVEEFEDVGDGVFFPKVTAIPGADNKYLRAVAEVLVVNDHLPRDAMNFKFPKNVYVRHSLGTALWGSNDAPIRDVSRAEIEASIGDFVEKESAKGIAFRPGGPLLISLNIVVVVGLVAFAVYRRRRK